MTARDDESLDRLLAELRTELGEWERGDKDPAELRRLVEAVEDRLERDDDEDDDDDSFLEELEEGVVRFESSHPTFAQALRKIADALGGVGL